MTNTTNKVKFYSYSDSRSAKSCITIKQTPEIVQYIESNAARMGVTVQVVVDAIITARYNNCRYKVRTEKAPMDRATYELRKQLELAQCRPADEVIEWRGYKFCAKDAVDILKRLNGQFSKPSKKQLLLFESEIAADVAPVQDQQPEPTPAPVEDIEAAVVAHFEELAANAPADDPAAPVTETRPEPTPASEKTETAPASQKTAADDFIETGAYPIWYNTELECTSGNGVEFKVVSWGRKQVKVEYIDGQRRIFKVREFIDSVERGYIIVSAPYDCEYMAILKRKREQPAALTDADVLAAAARIKSNYDAMKQQAAADTFADAIMAYCAALEEPAAPVWSPEVIILKEQPAALAVDAAPAPRHRRRLNIAPRLSRWLHPARWVAVAFVVCLLSGLLLGMNTSTAADAAADDIAAVYDLHPVTVTAAAVTDAPDSPSPVKKLDTPSPVKNAAADMATATAPAAVEAGKLPHNIHNIARIVEALRGRLAIVPEESPNDPTVSLLN